jgi:hypothetical protein
VAFSSTAAHTDGIPRRRSQEICVQRGGTRLELANGAMLIPEPGLVALIASGLLALASVVRTTTPL